MKLHGPRYPWGLAWMTVEGDRDVVISGGPEVAAGAEGCARAHEDVQLPCGWAGPGQAVLGAAAGEQG